MARAQADGRLVLTTTQFTDFGSMDAKFSPDTMAKLASLPGVDAVERLAEIEITLPNGSLAFVRAEDRPTFPFPVLAGQPPQQSVDANQLDHWRYTRPARTVFASATRCFSAADRARRVVVGTILATPEVGGRRIQMSYRLAEQIFGPQPAGLVFVKPAATRIVGAEAWRRDWLPVGSTSRSRPPTPPDTRAPSPAARPDSSRR